MVFRLLARKASSCLKDWVVIIRHFMAGPTASLLLLRYQSFALASSTWTSKSETISFLAKYQITHPFHTSC